MNNKNNIQQLSNEELLDLYKKEAKPVYFGELYRRYIPLVYGLCLKYLGEEPDAQDAVMDVYEEVQQKMHRYDVRNFHTWLYSVAKNHCLQRLRKDKQALFVNIDHADMENEDVFTLLDKAKTSEEETALAYCLDELTVEQRRSVEFFYYENKSYADIVSLTGYTLAKVKSYIQNGKRNLKNCILGRLKKD